MHPSAESYRAETVARAVPGVAGYVDWPAIFAGTALAVALSFVLLTFGSAIGLSVASFEPGEGVSLRWLAIASGLWFLWVAITGFGAGGYLAGRLQPAGAGHQRRRGRGARRRARPRRLGHGRADRRGAGGERGHRRRRGGRTGGRDRGADREPRRWAAT